MDHEHIDEMTPESEISPKQSTAAASPYIVPMSIVVAGVLIAGAVVYSSRWQGTPSQQGLAGAQVAGGAAVAPLKAEDIKALADDDPVLGNPDAPVTMVEFADFQCPFCGKFQKTVMPQIIEKYVRTGKVKFVYRDFAFLGKESEIAALGAECAKDQDKFWDFHDYLYAHQDGENEGGFAKEKVRGFAKVLGLDMAKFNACFDSGKYAEEISKDTADGRKYGVNGTPATFIDGRMISGAVPFEDFDAAITEALKAH